MMTRSSAMGSTAARRSFCMGLPPQSRSTAPPSLTKTIEVLSRPSEGTAPEVPRNAKCTAGPSDGRGAGAAKHERNPNHRHGDTEQAHQLSHAERPQHERIGANALGDEAARRVEPEIGEEERPRRPLEPPPKPENEREKHAQVPQGFVEERRMEEVVLRVEQ